MSNLGYKLIGEMRNYCQQLKHKNQVLQAENTLLKYKMRKTGVVSQNIIELKKKLKKETRKLNCCILDHGIDYRDAPFDLDVAKERKEKIQHIMDEFNREV